MIVLYHRNTVPEILQFLGQSKITETVKVHYVVIPFRIDYPMNTWPHRNYPNSRFRIPLVNNALRMKTPLKYGTRIHLASTSKCTLVVASEGIFIVFLAFFFLCSYTLSAFVRAESVFVRVHICAERDTVHSPVPLRDRDIAAPRADVARLCYCLSLSPHWPLHQARIQARPI